MVIICPSCRREVKRKDVSTRRPFPCPNCRKLLRVRPLSNQIPAYCAIVLSTAVGYLLGFRFITLILFALVFWLPAAALLGLVSAVTLDPKLEEYYPDYLDLNPRIRR